MNDEILTVRDVKHVYEMGTHRLEVLKNVSFSIKKGTTVSIVGPSGSGKSTLLGLIAGLDAPTEGRVFVGGVDLVVLVGQRAVNAVGLLRHDIDPASLVAAREARVRASARHVVEHRDVFRDADRVLGGEHDAKLPDPDALGPHADEEVEQHRVVGELEALQVKMVLGKADGVVAELVGENSLLADLLEHSRVEIAPEAGAAVLDLCTAPDRRQVEQGNLHGFAGLG